MSKLFYNWALKVIRKTHKNDKNDYNGLNDGNLTYFNAGIPYLYYGLDNEWKNFGRYDIIQNAIARLAELEYKVLPEYDESIRDLQNKIAEQEKLIHELKEPVQVNKDDSVVKKTATKKVTTKKKAEEVESKVKTVEGQSKKTPVKKNTKKTEA